MNVAVDWRVASAPEDRVLEARDVHLNYGGRRVLQAVHLRARPGRLLALIGPNGAGKSSLLGILAGLLRPSLGVATLDGVPLMRWPAAELARRRAMLSQRVQLGFAFRADEVAMLGRSLYGAASPDAADRRVVEAAMQATGTWELRARNYLELSGGEQQRVQLARVLAQVWDCRDAPGWLLLDEPEAGLDIAHQHELLRHARGMAERGFGVIAVLHDLSLAARYADDVALLAQGQLARQGSVEQVLDGDVLSRIYGTALSCDRDPRGRLSIHAA
ncbi:heme ABC transporter ATP-binding protein [Dyella sp. BiH032]|uniref:heme ABC transporter ATP-binding protein n=1 Tax=Dyella sp. BiH032 TaxID=3075430 RepID=UPI0028935B3C|nr:heme ABC transporter ATP-binding protein [Dyella sp. BiH032]WNL44150.1 heme ABC transporter ATP-binding protein [Dyella sp. BiH032]